MTEFQEKCVVRAARRITDQIVQLTVAAPRISGAAQPGQFVMIRVSGLLDPLLRRPLSIHRVLPDGALVLLFKIVGRGTDILATMTAGDQIDIIGPLGRGFDLRGDGPVCLVGGGMGIAPLLFLAEQRQRSGRCSQDDHVLIGAANRDELAPLAEEFSALGYGVQTATDDGSMGLHGFVPELLDGVLASVGRVYTCGPWPMMRAVAASCQLAGIACQVSLEARMACGLGACLGCTLKGAAGSYIHVCRQGPVVEAGEVAWE
jgi:dihydroorotate dehydrogenase electron transfer subunit